MRGHLLEAAVGAWSSRRWRATILLFVVLCHAAFFYAIWSSHDLRVFSAGLPKDFTAQTLFGAVMSDKSATLKDPIVSKPVPASRPLVEWAAPPRLWKFPAIDLWPSPVGFCPVLTDYNIEARTDTPEPPILPQHTQGAPGPRPRHSMLRLVRWLRPVYPIESALTNMEGAALLDLRIDSQGQPIQVTMTRSSGAPALDAAGEHAVHFWRFAPPLWKGHPIPVSAQIELRFHFFTFEFSRLGALATTAALRSQRHGRRPERMGGHEPAVHRLIESLQSGTPEHTLDPHVAAAQQALSAALEWWGPVMNVSYVGFEGDPEWRTYAIKREYRRRPRVTSVAVRWEIYEVSHAAHTSLWKGAFDRTGQLWAMKADLVPSVAGAGCVNQAGATRPSRSLSR